ncbi:hypothetical protein O6H91_07G119100 [Diphasiastrum complanatum]|uniref:Uncharacterized protein n=2 Tax=Diphasiastrum complanatum TaxID=34168 RepID=A0ACC2D9L0_DIPCM|nr:hypothetical protein O6H91_07G119100 [Diphasiastrum complanatum]KAJ7550806.1 hypothetical protein O6H91_07G119100 [Diphasiastrum complanatum]
MAGVLREGISVQRSTLPSQELLDDLCSRFVLNAPEEELQSFERILFLVEQAHWFYEDNAVEQNLILKSFSLREFTSLMFHSCAALRPYISHFDDIYKDFTTYKTSVPVTGAIILGESYERCLLVKGWKAGASWSFPRGKKSKDEEDHSCAIREVWEETGFDVSRLLKPEDYLEVVIGQQRMRLYIISGVTDDTVFVPQTKKEISEIAWHRIDELPMATNELSSHNRGPNGMKYFMVWPFVRPLKAWIAGHVPAGVLKNDSSNRGSTVWKVRTTSSTISCNTGLLGTVAATSFNTPLLPARTESAELDMPPTKELPGKSFRDFKFDFPEILQSLETN